MTQHSNFDTPIDAYELAVRVMNHPQGGVEALVRLAEGPEADWLELKAGLGPEPGKSMKKGENKRDYYWHAARALIAMANTCGGALILGIWEDKDNNKLIPDGLKSCDPDRTLSKKGIDEFLRKRVFPAIRPDQGCWKTGKAGHWQVSHEYLQSLTCEMGTYEEHDVVVVLVPPIPKGDRLLIADETLQGREILFVRDRGDVGRNRGFYRDDDKKEYSIHREVATARYAKLWKQFFKDILEHNIKEYLRTNILEKPEMREAYETYVDIFFLPEIDEYSDFEIHVGSKEEKDYSDEYADFDKNALELEKCLYEQEDKLLFSEPELVAKNIISNFSRDSKPLMVTGASGSGKTTLLRFVAYKLAIDRLNNRSTPCPVMLNLSTESEDKEKFDNRTASLLCIDEKEVRGLMAEGTFAYLFDGFDEIPDKNRFDIQTKIDDLLYKLKQKLVVISSRYQFAISGHEKSFYEMRLQSPKEDQAIEIIARYIKGRDLEEARSIWEQIEKNDMIREIALRPLMLKIIVHEMARTRFKFDSFGHLMRKFSKQVLKRELNRRITIHEKYAPRILNQVRHQLSNIAFNMLCQDKLAIDVGDLGEYSDHEIDPVEWCKDASLGEEFEKGGEGGDLYFRFKHETIRDYFSAEYLQRKPNTIKKLAKIRARNSCDDQNYDLSIKRRIAPIILASELYEYPSEFLRHPSFIELPPKWREAVLLETRIPGAVSALADYCSLKGMPQNPITIIDERQVRKAAVLSLSTINTPEARQMLIQLSKSKNDVTRLFTVVGLGKTHTHIDVVNELFHLLSDKNIKVAEKAFDGLVAHKKPLSSISIDLLRCYLFACRQSIQADSILAAIKRRMESRKNDLLPYIEPNEELRKELMDVNKCAKQSGTISMKSLMNYVIALLRKFGPAVEPPSLINENHSGRYIGIFSANPRPGMVKCTNFSGPVPCNGSSIYRFNTIDDGACVRFTIQNLDENNRDIYVVEKLEKVPDNGRNTQ